MLFKDGVPCVCHSTRLLYLAEIKFALKYTPPHSLGIQPSRMEATSLVSKDSKYRVLYQADLDLYAKIIRIIQ